MAEVAEGILPILAQRSWSLAVVTDARDDFICSDRPVILAPTEPNLPPFLGFGMRKTEVIMPLNRKMATVGQYESEGQVFNADPLAVGLFIQRTLHFAERFVYLTRETFRGTVPKQVTSP